MREYKQLYVAIALEVHFVYMYGQCDSACLRETRLGNLVDDLVLKEFDVTRVTR